MHLVYTHKHTPSEWMELGAPSPHETLSRNLSTSPSPPATTFQSHQKHAKVWMSISKPDITLNVLPVIESHITAGYRDTCSTSGVAVCMQRQ